ncbi:MAG: DUF3127 domain-containing protein [Bacteroidaceae bacterium]|nr:DUF3127 domain-containing protein [Bacteroidaceae bacterium]
MDFTGKVIAILQPKSGVSKTSGNEWKAQDYVVENHDQYPRKLCFTVFGADKVDQFNIQMGEEITVSFDVDAHQWQDRWFNSIRAWKVVRVTADTTESIAAQSADSGFTPPTPTTTNTPAFTPNEANDDLPF